MNILTNTTENYKRWKDKKLESFTRNLDDLTVRGTMNVFELLIHQIRATNGSLFVSNTGKIILSC